MGYVSFREGKDAAEMVIIFLCVCVPSFLRVCCFSGHEMGK